MWEDIVLSIGEAVVSAVSSNWLEKRKRDKFTNRINTLIGERMSRFADTSLDCNDFYSFVNSRKFKELVRNFFCSTQDGKSNSEYIDTIGLNVSCDTDRQLIYKYIYTLKDLRNAIAHNSVVFDTRFRNIDPTNAMKQCLKLEIGLPYVNFKTIGDYIILMCYYLKLLKVSKTEIKAFIREFEKITDNYRQNVNPSVAGIVIHPDLTSRMNALKNYI